ncbi:MAG: hypothetical protein V3T70_06685 [Phycisphaerae bacterium]
MLQRILQRGSLETGRLGEVIVGDLQVVFGGDQLRIPDPRADDVQRIGLGQFRLARGAQVVERLRPRLEAGAADDLGQLRPQVLIRAAIPGHHEFGPGLGLLEGLP